jgi:hypothetical protein
MKPRCTVARLRRTLARILVPVQLGGDNLAFEKPLKGEIASAKNASQ